MSPSTARRDEGFTLIELLVVMLIGGVVGSVVLTATVQSLRTTVVIQDRVEALATLEKGMERITRELRAANPLQLDFEGDYFNAVTSTVTRGGKRIAYRYEIKKAADGSDTLVQTTYTYTLDGLLEPGVESNVITELQNLEDPNNPVNLLTFLDSSGNPLTCPVDPEDSCLPTLLKADQVRLTLLRTLPGADPLTLESTVRIRALRYTSDPTNLGIIVGELQP